LILFSIKNLSLDDLRTLNEPIYVTQYSGIDRTKSSPRKSNLEKIYSKYYLTQEQKFKMHTGNSPIDDYKKANEKQLNNLVALVRLGQINDYKHFSTEMHKLSDSNDPDLRFKIVLERLIEESRQDIDFSNKFRSLIFDDLSNKNLEIEKDSQIQVSEFENHTPENTGSIMFNHLTKKLDEERKLPVNPNLIYDFITRIIHDERIEDRSDKLLNLCRNITLGKVNFKYVIPEQFDLGDPLKYKENGIIDLNRLLIDLSKKSKTDTLVNGKFEREAFGPAKRKVLKELDKLIKYNDKKEDIINSNIKGLILLDKFKTAIDRLNTIYDCYDIGAL